MNARTFLERWAVKPAERRDREFYLLALPAAVAMVGLAPYVFQLMFFPGAGGFLRLSAQVAAGAVMIGVICYAFTRLLSRPRWWGPKRSRWPLLTHLLLLWTPTALLVDAPLRLTELSMIDPGVSWTSAAPYILGVSMGRTFLFAGGIVFYERLMGAVAETMDQRQRALWLETQTLKSLIQPHFLLNSLNAVRAYMEESPADAEKMLLRLTSLLRKVIQNSSKERITIAEEMNVIEDYVAVMRYRYETDVRLQADGVDGSPVRIPPLILFTLVENSFKHGFSGRREGSLRISVEAGERVRLMVNDDGRTDGGPGEAGGLGGQYIRARLELAYGGDYSFQSGRLPDGHYEAVIEIPWEAA